MLVPASMINLLPVGTKSWDTSRYVVSRIRPLLAERTPPIASTWSPMFAKVAAFALPAVHVPPTSLLAHPSHV